MRLVLTTVCVLALTSALAACDLLQPTDDGPPATMTGQWTTGAVEIPVDTTLVFDSHPTYASAEFRAVVRARTTLTLTDNAGDVRGRLEDRLSSQGEIRYRRHDGVVVTDPFATDALGGASDRIEAVYVAPTLTVTSVGSYLLGSHFVNLALDFSDGTARMPRRFTVPVMFHRAGPEGVLRVVGAGEVTFRRAPAES